MPDETQNRTSALCSLHSQGTQHQGSDRLFQERDTVSNLWSGQVMLLFPCFICKATMCVPEHRDSARKCSEAGRLKDFFQLKSDARGLHAALPDFVPVRLDDFLPCRAPERYQFQVNQPECPKPFHWAVASCNERFCRDFSSFVSKGSFSSPPDDRLLLSASCEVGEAAEGEQRGGERAEMNKVVCSVCAGSYSARLCVYLRGCREVRTLTDTQVWLLLMRAAAKSEQRDNT